MICIKHDLLHYNIINKYKNPTYEMNFNKKNRKKFIANTIKWIDKD